MKLSMKTEKCETLTFEVYSLDTLDNVKAKMTRKGYHMSNWQINWEYSEQIFVIAAHDDKICIGYKCSDTIYDLMSKITDRECIVPYEQSLFFAGMLLDKGSSRISRYNISQGSTLDLVGRRKKIVSISVVITTTGENLSLEVRRYHPSWVVKKMIMDQTGIDLAGKMLVNVYAGAQLVGRQNLYYMDDGATLYLVDETVINSRTEIKIYVKIYPSRKTIELNVVNFDTISSVKSLIQDKERIPIGQQLLYLTQKRLEDTFTLAHYFILNESTLYLQTTSHTPTHPREEETEKGGRGRVWIDRFTPQQHRRMQLVCSNNFILEVNGSETFCTLKESLQDMGYGLGGCHINFESKIDPNSRTDKVLVRLFSGKSIALIICRNFTIFNLKQLIYSAEGISCNAQMLFFAGLFLGNCSTLYDYEIYPGFTLDGMLEFRGDLRVKTTSREIIYMHAPVNLTIGKVKDLIKEQTGVPADQQRLVNIEAGEELVDTRTLGSCLLCHNTILRLVEDTTWMMSRNEMKVYVKIVATGDTIELDVVSCDTIRTLKNMIQETEHIPVGLQILYLPQKRLNDTFTLAHYFIMNETTLYLAQIPEYNEGILEELTMDREGKRLKRLKL